MAPGGFSASPAYDFGESDNDLWEGRMSHGDIEITTGQTLYPDITPKPNDIIPCANLSDNGVGTVPSSTKARRSSVATIRNPRPQALQQTAPVSAPEVPRRMPGKGSSTPERAYQTRRAVSQGRPTIHSQKLDQNAPSLPVIRVMDASMEAASPSSNKRRRSDQDVAHKSFDDTPDLVRAQIASSPSRALPSKSLPPHKSSPCSKTSDGTSQHPNSGIEFDPSHEDDRSSENLSDTATKGPLDSILPGLGRKVSGTDPYFEPFHKVPLSAVRVAHKVFKTMRTPLCEKPDIDVGHIYILRIAERPEFVKIGRTKDAIDNRVDQIKSCLAKTYTLEAFNDDDFCSVNSHTRVERLIHDELRNYRRSFSCSCKQKKHDDTNDGLTTHGEWFELDKDKAVEVVERWRTWMRTKPYSDRALKHRELLRINIYHRDPGRMKAMTIEKDNEWSWDIFMENPLWYLYRLQLYDVLFGERYKRSTCSPWDSLWKHWKSNVLFCVVFFGLSCVLSVMSSVLSSSAFAPIHAVLSTLILGGGAILYAA